MAEPRKVILYCDGASRGNPGPGSYGFVILENGEPIAEVGKKLGEVTNNVAEYEGVIEGLTRCLELGATEVTVRSDSQLLVRQLTGQYKVKAPHLLPLVQKAKALQQRFTKVAFQHVPREENKPADKLANAALDGLLAD